MVDFVLTACHSYNESYKIGRHVGEGHGLPYLKIESNYSTSDEEQIRTKSEALFEIAGGVTSQPCGPPPKALQRAM